MTIESNRFWHALAAALLLLGAPIAAAAAADEGDHPAPHAAAAASPEVVPAEQETDGRSARAAGTGRAASWVTLDPDSGEPLAGLAEEADRPPLSPRLEAWLSRSTAGLYERALPGGGFAVALEGRFRNLTVVRIDEEGEIERRCLDAVPPGPPASRGATAEEGPPIMAPLETDGREHDHE